MLKWVSPRNFGSVASLGIGAIIRAEVDFTVGMEDVRIVGISDTRLVGYQCYVEVVPVRKLIQKVVDSGNEILDTEVKIKADDEKVSKSKRIKKKKKASVVSEISFDPRDVTRVRSQKVLIPFKP